MGKVPPGLYFTTLSDGYSDGGDDRDDMENDITVWLWRGLRCLFHSLLRLWSKEGLGQSVTAGTLIWGHGATILSSQDQSDLSLTSLCLNQGSHSFSCSYQVWGKVSASNSF